MPRLTVHSQTSGVHYTGIRASTLKIAQRLQQLSSLVSENNGQNIPGFREGTVLAVNNKLQQVTISRGYFEVNFRFKLNRLSGYIKNTKSGSITKIKVDFDPDDPNLDKFTLWLTENITEDSALQDIYSWLSKLADAIK